MGSAPLIALTADQDSPTEPGKQSVLTDEIKVPWEAFYDEILDFMKYPVPPQMEAVLKEVKITDAGPDEFTVMVIADGAKLTAYGFGNKEKPNMDLVAHYTGFKLDKKNRRMVSQTFGPSSGFWIGDLDKFEGNPCLNATVVFLEDPFRVEYWWDTTDSPQNGLSPGTRYSGDMVRDVLSPILQGVATKFANLKVTTMPDQASPSGGGEKSVVSNTLGEDEVTFDALFDGLVAVIKEAPDPNVVVTDVSDTQFTLELKLPDGSDTFRTVTHDKEKGTIVSELKMNGALTVTDNYALHKSPLQFETWSVTKDGRMSGRAVSRECQKLWNAAFAKATSANSWFSW